MQRRASPARRIVNRYRTATELTSTPTIRAGILPAPRLAMMCRRRPGSRKKGTGLRRALHDEGSMIMCTFSPLARRALLAAGAVLALTVASATFDRAQAQGKLIANYTISVARIPVGKITWSADIGDESYTISGSGEASGVASFLAGGKGSLSTRGTVKDGQLSPTEFTSDITQDDEKGELKMVLDQGSVTELKADAPAKAAVDRVPVTAAHQQGVVDPLTAWLIPAAGEGNGLGRAACERTLPIFDGQK